MKSFTITNIVYKNNKLNFTCKSDYKAIFSSNKIKKK